MRTEWLRCRGVWGAQVWFGRIERKPVSQAKVGDPKVCGGPVDDDLGRNLVRQDHANPAAEILDTSDAEVSQYPLDIMDEAFLEVFAVAAFEGDFVVVDDSAAHGLTGC